LEQYVASIFRVEEQAEQEINVKAEDGGGMSSEATVDFQRTM
jgi:hypothetical protein